MSAYVNGQGAGWLGAYLIALGFVTAVAVGLPALVALTQRLWARRSR